MKAGTIADGRKVKIFRMKEWAGLRGDDKIASLDPDEKMFVRDGVLYIYSDREYAAPSPDFIPLGVSSA